MLAFGGTHICCVARVGLANLLGPVQVIHVPGRVHSGCACLLASLLVTFEVTT